MKKTIFVLAICFFVFGSTIKAQNCEQRVKELTSQRDSLQMLYFDALSILDSTVGTNNRLTEQLKNRNAEIAKLKKEIDNLRKKNQKLEADMKRQ